MYAGQYLDDLDKITVGEVWRLQNLNPDGYAWHYDADAMEDDGNADGDPWEYRTAVFRIERITDGRGRFYQCDGKLTIDDTIHGVQEFPLVWRRSNLNRGGFWVLVGCNIYGRTLYRTRYGWRMAAQIRETPGALYREQSHSKERRRGRGRWGAFEFMFKRAGMLDDWREDTRNRKFFYRGEPTPFLRRYVKQFRKYRLPLPPSLADI